MIDFAAIKARHSIESVLERRYNLVLRRAAGGWLIKCPIHGEQKGTSFGVNERKQLWRCYGKCQSGGSVLDLVMAMEGAANALAAAEILEGRPLTEEEKSQPRPQRLARLQFRDERAEALAEMPLPKMFRAERLREAPQHYFEIIAKARGLHWRSIQMAHDAGCLRFCQAQWKFEDRHTGETRLGTKFNTYAILDAEHSVNVQFRRMDVGADGKALCFWRDTKVMGWYGNRGDWPVGVDVAIANPQSTILLVEGTGDFLAGWDIRGLGYDVIPVGIFGASNKIFPHALPFFERRKVIIAQQHDVACQVAAERWTQQLTAHNAQVRTWLVPSEGADLNDYISEGGDAEAILKP
jgi:hypothetical protein